MELGDALLALGAGERPARFEQFSAAIDPQWIADALARTDAASVRRRKLPADLVVWLVIAMGLFRDRAIAAVVHHLGLVLPAGPRRPGRVSNAAIVQARDKLGPEPLAALFQQTATAWAGAATRAARWRGLVLFGVDGTTLRVPDSAENEHGFGRPGTNRGGAGAAYPQVRLVVLLGLRSHLLAAAAFGPYATSERALARPLWAELPTDSLVILDRGFAGYALFHHLTALPQAPHWLVRLYTGPHAIRWQAVARLGRDDFLVELQPGASTRAAYPTLPPTLRARALRVRRRGFRPYVLLTSLLDARTHPAAELTALYHERWELELAFDEVKTHTLERVETLRSKAPLRIAQELWGLLLAYNLVRLMLARAAPRAAVPPLRLSYRHAVLVLRSFWLTAWTVAPGTVPRHVDRLLDDLALAVLPVRRPRHFPRRVKIKMSAYDRKRPITRGRRDLK